MPSLIRISLFGAVLFLMGVTAAHADYPVWRLEVTCDYEAGRVEIVPYAFYDRSGAIYEWDVYSPEIRDCTLAPRRTVRAKLGIGLGYRAPDTWVSIWIDRALVLSRESFGCFYEGPCGLRISVTSEGMEVCHSRAADDGAGGSVRECDVTANDALPREPDVLQFPGPDDRKKPVPGSVATLFARDREFCSRFRRPTGELGLPGDAELIEPWRSWPYEYAGRYGSYVFDIDNDGSDETVIGLRSRTRYRDGDIYFVYTDGAIPEPEIERHGSSELEYATAADRILPHYWVDPAGAAEKAFAQHDRNNSNYKVKSAEPPWWDEDDRPIFSLRYLHLRPFRYGQSTYFLTSSTAGHWYTVLRPEPDFGATEMCIFQIVQVRY